MKENKELNLIAILLAFVFLIVSACVVYTHATKDIISFDQIEYKIFSNDTLWGIAKKYCPEEMDLRQWIYLVEEINGIDGGNIKAGDTITILVERGR